jgi:hypothetical protein
MFNLSKIIKSWFGGSMEKQASREQLLEEERKSQGLSSAETPEIYESLMNKKEKTDYHPTTEGQFDRKKSTEVDSIAEGRMDKDLSYSVRSNDDVREEVPRINVATEKWDNEYREAYAKAEKSLEKQTDIFEKYKFQIMFQSPHLVYLTGQKDLRILMEFLALMSRKTLII